MAGSKNTFPQQLLSRALRALMVLSLVGMSVASVEAANVTLAWDKSNDSSVTGYAIYFGTKAGSYSYSINVGNQTSYQVAGLSDGVPYFFVVYAYNSSGVLSVPSTEVSTRVGVMR